MKIGSLPLTALGVPFTIRYARRMRDTSDETLMLQYASGNMAAFEELYERYRGSLYRYFIRQVSNPATANDLYQGSWEKVIRARGRYRSSAPFKAWLFRIAHNHLVDFYRAAKPSAQIAGDAPDTAQAGPSETLAHEERRAQFRTALLNLPPDQKDALLLKIEVGLDLEEIGKMTGVGAETVKSRLRYATRKLKQALQT